MSTDQISQSFGFDTEDILKIETICQIFNGRIVSVTNNPKSTKEKKK